MPYPIPPEVRVAWDKGDKILAIRLLRERAGMGLAEAKDLLESNAAEVEAPRYRPDRNGPLPPQVYAELARGNKIQAIKALRVATGLGLKDAKDLVDAAESEVSPPVRSRSSKGLMRGEPPSARLRTILLVVVVLVLVALSWLALN